MGNEPIPDATTLDNFRHQLKQHQLGEQLFVVIGGLLQSSGLKLTSGTIVDATIIAAPSSTKNKDQARDPEMRSNKKADNWYFGFKIHVGTDSKTGIVHSATTTAANGHDSQELPNLMHGNETRVYGDSAYIGQKTAMRKRAPKARDFTNKHGFRNHGLTNEQVATNRRKSKERARVEHTFLWIKRIWRFTKVRYRGLTKTPIVLLSCSPCLISSKGIAL